MVEYFMRTGSHRVRPSFVVSTMLAALFCLTEGRAQTPAVRVWLDIYSSGHLRREPRKAALTAVQSASPAEEGKPAFAYAEGMLLDALGQTREAAERLTQASRSAQDPLLQYLTGVALRELNTRATPR